MTTDHVTTTMTIVPQNGLVRAGETQRSEFGAMERRQSAELAAVHQAAVAEAQIKARYTMALHRPSSFVEVRSKLLKDCERPAFAATAWYAKPVGGGKVEGPSIRFAEAFMRARGNMVPESMVVHEDADQRILRVSLTDLESNTTLSVDKVMRKTVERRNGEGREVVGMRGATFIVRAYDDELADKEASIISKALRGLILRLCPGDLLDEAKETVFRVRRKGASDDPDKALRDVLDKFEVHLRIKPAMIAEYLGHPADVATPDEIEGLLDVYTAIKDGSARWSDFVADKPEAPRVTSTREAVIAQSSHAKAVTAEARDAERDAAEDARLERLREAAEKQAAPKPNAREMSQLVEARRAAYAALIRHDDETEDAARKRASAELGPVTSRTLDAWLANADRVIAAREEPREGGVSHG